MHLAVRETWVRLVQENQVNGKRDTCVQVHSRLAKPHCMCTCCMGAVDKVGHLLIEEELLLVAVWFGVLVTLRLKSICLCCKFPLAYLTPGVPLAFALQGRDG